MPKLTVYDLLGNAIEEIDVSDRVFDAEINHDLMHQIVVGYEANQRVGTASTKTRAVVSGGGRKPWRQKGTGRARAGSTRSPLWRHGGVAFGPLPRDYRHKLPKKMRQAALRSALTSKVKDGQLVVVDRLAFEEPKTKKMAEAIKNLQINKSVLVVTAEREPNTEKAARNLPRTKSTTFDGLNAYEVLRYNHLLITRDALRKVEEVLA